MSTQRYIVIKEEVSSYFVMKSKFIINCNNEMLGVNQHNQVLAYTLLMRKYLSTTFIGELII